MKRVPLGKITHGMREEAAAKIAGDDELRRKRLSRLPLIDVAVDGFAAVLAQPVLQRKRRRLTGYTFLRKAA